MELDTPLTPLAQIRRADAGRFGHKAANLGEAMAAGLPVPDGVALAHTVDLNGHAVRASLRAPLQHALEVLGWPVAVRSSGVAEDLADASFAGQYESVLNVRGLDEALDAVATCAHSARSGRVDAYRSAPASDGSSGMAILVQRMLNPRVAGVAFSADPITGRRTDAVVVAVPGLGEALVGGEARGTEWIVPEHGRPTLRGDDRAQGVLDEGSVRAVAALVRQARDIFGAPQDIEWAIADSKLWLLQSRPMTALPDEVGWETPNGFSGIRAFRFGEWLSDPVTPLFATWFLPSAHAGVDRAITRHDFIAPTPPWYCLVNGWYFTSPTGARHPLVFMALALAQRPRWFLRLMRVMRHPERADEAFAPFMEEWRGRVKPEYMHLAHSGIDLANTGTPHELFRLIEETSVRAGEVMASFMILGGHAWKTEVALAQFVRTHLAHVTDTHQPLVCGVGEAPRSAPDHAVQSLDWFHPTLGELGERGAHTIGDRHTRVIRERQDLEARCRAALARSPKLAHRFEKLLDVSQRYAVIREEQSDLLTLPWPALRIALKRLGGVAVSRGAVTHVDDVFFLERAELNQIVDGHCPVVDVESRRSQWKRQRRLRPPDVIGPRGPLFRRMLGRADALGRRDSDAATFVRGLGVSPGRATGVARVLRSPEEGGRLGPGEILVTSATTPAWTPLFTRAGAVITDTGSLAAHASLVAREYGLPAVVGTSDATRRLRDGMVVLVDGTAGTIELLALNDRHVVEPRRSDV